MQLKEYCEKANRTNAELEDTQLNDLHMILGMVTEIGELADTFKKELAYKKDLDWINIKEELGDIFWYLGNFCYINDINPEEILDINIAKLQSSYPDKFTEHNALNRDLEKERIILESLKQ